MEERLGRANIYLSGRRVTFLREGGADRNGEIYEGDAAGILPPAEEGI